MEDPPLTMIGDLEGFTPQIARLVGMLRYARQSVVDEVEHLTQAQLDHLQDPASNRIGALLHHIASIEWVYQLITLEERDPTEAEQREWGPALSLGDGGRRSLCGKPITHYLDLMAAVRQQTLRGLRARDDDWLGARVPGWDRPVNRHWCWFHVMEDELNHRGQIRWLKGRLPADRQA